MADIFAVAMLYTSFQKHSEHVMKPVIEPACQQDGTIGNLSMLKQAVHSLEHMLDLQENGSGFIGEPIIKRPQNA